MIGLRITAREPDDYFFYLERVNDQKLWRLIIGAPNKISSSSLTSRPHNILMNAADLRRFAKEIKKVLNKRPFSSAEFTLHPTFQTCEPKFLIRMKYDKHPWRGDSFDVRIGLNAKLRQGKWSDELGDYEYIFDEVGGYFCSILSITIDLLLEFVEGLKKEANEARWSQAKMFFRKIFGRPPGKENNLQGTP